MQNNVTELTQRLLRALDSNYNVINLPEVVQIISHLEKVAITKELLETTRLGKYVNELRRRTTDQELSRTAKELLKKWRSMVLPETNGQLKQSTQPSRAPSTELSPPLQGQQSIKPRISPGPPKKVSPPVPIPKMVSPALQSRLAAPSIQTLVSPQLQKRLVSPHAKMASPQPKVASPSQTARTRVSPKLPPGADLVPVVSPTLTLGADVNLNQVKQGKKRPIGGADGAGAPDSVNPKRSRLNGGVTDLDISDSSNSCFQDVNSSSALQNLEPKREGGDVIVVNSDSNSSFPDKTVSDDLSSDQIPKKRGRKKGSKNHRSLLDEAETSFTNKLAVSASRGGSKVKTTQEILAGIQNKNTVAALSAAAGITRPSFEDLEEKAAKLTERVSMIDRKLNANSRNKNSQKSKLNLGATKNERVIESGSVINDKSLLDRLKREKRGEQNELEEEEEEEEDEEDEEEIVVDDTESAGGGKESQETERGGGTEDQLFTGAKSLSEEEALALLPPVDRSVLDVPDPEPPCTCLLKENQRRFASAFSIGDEEVGGDRPPSPPPFEVIEDPACPARHYIEHKYRVHDVSEEKIRRLHESFLPNINGNWSLGTPRPEAFTNEDGLYANVVPNIYERLDKDVKPFDSFKKYSVSEGDPMVKEPHNVIKEEEEDRKVNGGNRSSLVSDKQEIGVINANSDTNGDDGDRTATGGGQLEVFREWYECIDTPSYHGDALRILPYCIVD
ncbi:mediator of RNA polymerase II transcription subunit 26-like isoform X2 [Anthonomus grandis grandis]|uniref:mediator of RNA polymerase II transcription subunit 26-like isoform X2 n=1 Tax=Anthonomus grandis grandis TaxID=2921223 RepID=UPI002165DA30|nr:mediator of RNA polymerase II transcription subunit 26-like isoform X2 [Anthonomus grandis grandis]